MTKPVRPPCPPPQPVEYGVDLSLGLLDNLFIAFLFGLLIGIGITIICLAIATL